ncbi:MAG TPA: 3'-5' exonuclease, partial [Ktedonobacterales bacterium]|nr:3'-5' exonuclease [Ktedonobacterales bacterium]
TLTPDQQCRLDAWRSLPNPTIATATDERWVVIDVESSGLNPRRDSLIAVGAVAVVAQRIALGQSYYRVLRQDTPSATENILVHRIGTAEQLGGVDPREALVGLLEFTGKAPCVAYNASFDAAMLERAACTWLGERLHLAWLDLAWLAPAVAREAAGPRRPLEVWLEAFGIPSAVRHHALADALATAQLLLVLERRAAEQGMQTVGELRRAAAGERWLARGIR